MKISDIKTDCRFFKGHIPCKPSKNYGVHCTEKNGSDCKYYEPAKEKILIIKLGAIGDVIRTTPLLSAIRNKYPNGKIFWLTYTPSVVPANVDEVLKFNPEGITFLEQVEFDQVYNLDKDKEACALTTRLKSKNKKGYILKNGVPFPADPAAEPKYFTGLFDDVNKENTKNYPEEIFEICGFEFKGEKYILSNFEEYSDSWNLDKSKKIIGLNTGCGGRWTTRLWADENWINLAKSLITSGYEVIFLGGELENSKNKKFAQATGSKYFGHFNLDKFINLVDQCDLVVTGVTMAMHITLGLNKKIVLFNNIFNPKEFELYGLGKIIQPEKECKCFFRGTCINPEYKCMDYIKTEKVLETIGKLLT
ncbi:MAG TPA: glycosyltransferase family 9 protein [Ignavibacteriaceae bacterium]|nr:glycosyltransferase family 9 protein [Ignavibacteriaceae bacterium]